MKYQVRVWIDADDAPSTDLAKYICETEQQAKASAIDAAFTYADIKDLYVSVMKRGVCITEYRCSEGILQLLGTGYLTSTLNSDY